MAARELFVWYRVRRERAAEAHAAVLALQRSMRNSWPGLQGRLLARDDGDTSTWMETYSIATADAGDGVGIDERIEAAIAAAALSLDGIIDGPRHVEAFVVAA